MDEAAWIALGSGFGGAIIGAGSSLIGQWIQQRADRKKHLISEAVRAATEQYKIHVEMRSRQQLDPFPLSTHIITMVQTFRELDKHGSLSIEKAQEIRKRNHDMMMKIHETDQEYFRDIDV